MLTTSSRSDLFKGKIYKPFLYAVALSMLPLSSAAFSAPTLTHQKGFCSSAQKVSFKNHLGIDVAGHMYHPAGFDNNSNYTAIVAIPPAGGAKEQTAGLYAQKLAGEGFVTIVFDASFQGESGGQPRFQENPVARVEDVRGAVDFLVSLPYVDENRIGVFGICAGGGYAASAAMTERRIKAVGVVVPVEGGRNQRAGGREATITALQDFSRLRSSEARGGETTIIPWISDSYQNATDIDTRESYDYYLTPRARHPNWQNKVQLSAMDAVIAFDAFYLADMLLTQPLQIVVGSLPGSFNSNLHGHALYDVSASTQKEIVVVEGASHFDLYDRPEYVNQAVARLSAFYATSLVQ